MKKTIFHLVHSLDVGGMENGLVNILNRMERKNLQHIVCSLTTLGPMRQRIKAPNVTFRAFHITGRNWLFSLALRKMITAIRPQVVHVRGWGPLFDAVAATRLSGFSTGLIFSYHGRSRWEAAGIPTLERWKRTVLLNQTDRIVTLNSFMAGDLEKSYSLPANSIAIIGNGTDPHVFRPRLQKNAARKNLPGVSPVAGATLLIGCVGRLTRIKNSAFLLQALARFKNTTADFKLLLIGDGPEMQALTEQTAALGLADNIIFLGQRQDIPRLLPGLDLYVQTSLYEGFSNAILEAMACGLPILCSDVGGNRHLVHHGGNGFLFRLNGGDDFLAYLNKLYYDTALRQQFANRSRQMVLENFTLAAMAQKYQQLYEEM